MRESFVWHEKWEEILGCLDADTELKFCRAIRRYALYAEEPEFNAMERAVWCDIRNLIDHDKGRYEERCRVNRENGAKGGRPKKTEANPKKPKETQRNRTVFSETQQNPEKPNHNRTKPKKPDIDIDIDIDVDIDINKYFAQFWSKYPRRVGKANAEKSFIKAFKGVLGQDRVTLYRNMENALEWQIGTEQWQKDGGKYIPYPATWLNQRRWEDEIEPIKPKQEQAVSYDMDAYRKKAQRAIVYERSGTNE